MSVCRKKKKTAKGIELNNKIDGVMLRTLHSEAMNESPILRGKVGCLCACVCVCVQIQESIWRHAGAKLAHNLVSVERSVKIWLPALSLSRPPSLASWSETTHAAYQTEAFQVSFNVFQGLASQKGQLSWEEQGENKHKQGEDNVRELLVPARSLTRASIIKAPYAGDPAAPVLWQHWDSMLYRTVSLPCCQQHRFSLNPRLTSKSRRSQTRVQKTWKVKLRTSTKNPSTYPLSHLSNGYLGGLFATVTAPVRLACDGKITGLSLAATAVLVLS